MQKETIYWQRQYQKGKIPADWLENCAGETLSLLAEDDDVTIFTRFTRWLRSFVI